MSRLREERGVAVAIVLMIMLTTAILGSAAVLAATRSNHLTNRDGGYKAALEAADAGIRTATYRMNMLGTQDTYCPTVPATTWSATTRLCGRDGPSSDDTRWADSAPDDAASHLGNGGTFSYWISAPMSTGDKCAGNTVVNSLYLIAQRCVTSVGTVNGVSARTQARIAAFAAKPWFPGAGLIGVKSISIKPGNGGGASIFATSGSNGAITLGNNVTLDGTGQSNAAVETGPSGSLALGNNGDVLLPSSTPLQVDSSQFNLTAIDPGCSNQGIGPDTNAADTCYYQNASNPGWNADDRIAGCTATGSATVDKCSSLTWNASTRSVSIANGGSLWLNSSSLPYNFCNFTTGNNVTINVPIGARVMMFIDSPADPNSRCPAGSGIFTLGNGTMLNNLNNDPLALKFAIYGDPTNRSANAVTWNNNAQSTYAVLYAPNSTVNMQNNGAFWGGISGYNLNITNNFTFHWVNTVATLQGSPQGLYYRAAWEQCPSNPPVSAPASGC